jgi:NAD(P)-dependent dehydrogenase (short-subunit alcohol dehydrogenase family)
MQRICVIDGQGGGIGGAVIRKLKEAMGESVEIIALGTNAIATAQMLKAKAHRGASGENAIVRTVPSGDAIIGSVAILMANAMMGELTPRMAEAICSSGATKYLLPLSQENISIAGVSKEPLPHLIDALIDQLLRDARAGRGG